MVARITPLSHSPIFSPLLTRAGQEHNPPAEYKGWDKIPDLQDIAKDEKTRSQINDEKGKWIKELFNDITLYKDKIKEIMQLGYTKEEAKKILKLFVLAAERSTDWAINAAHKCGNAVNSILFACPFAFVKALINNFGLNVSGGLKRTISCFDGLFTGIRNYFQNMIYGGRFDDDRARNKYEAKVYGNKIGEKYGDRAFNTETKVNPWGLPLIGLLGGKIQDILKPFLISQNPQWFRVRMGSDINQKFSTDFIDFLIHKPLSLLGFKKSKKIVDEIKERRVLSSEYVGKRLIENIGLDPTKNKVKDIIPETFKLTGGMLNGKTELKVKKKFSEKISKCFGPFLGLYGFLGLYLGAPLKAAFKLFNKENRFANSFFQSGFASQHIAYIFKFVFPEQYENELMEPKTSQEVKKLKSDKNNLYYSGMVTFLSNVFAVGTKLLNIENKYLRFARDIFDEITDKGVAYYFSKRRNLIGRKHKIDNSELYNADGSVKIISDKLEELEKEEETNPSEPEPTVSEDIKPPVLN